MTVLSEVEVSRASLAPGTSNAEEWMFMKKLPDGTWAIVHTKGVFGTKFLERKLKGNPIKIIVE